MNPTSYSPTRKLLKIEELAKKYNVDRLNVLYQNDKHQPDFITIPLSIDLFIQLKVWIAYDPKTDELSYSKRLIGVNNYWLTQLSDDHKNKRIDLNDYLNA